MNKNNYFVHETSYVDNNVRIGKGTKIWHFSHIQSGANIGQKCSIGQNVNIGNNVIIGDNCKIQNNVSVYEGVELEDFVSHPDNEFITDKERNAFYILAEAINKFISKLLIITSNHIILINWACYGSYLVNYCSYWVCHGYN